MVQVLWLPAEVDVRSGLTGTTLVDQLAILAVSRLLLAVLFMKHALHLTTAE